jgi:hypothetical protein
MVLFEYESEYDEIFKINLRQLDEYLVQLGYELRSDILDNGKDFVYLPIK